MKIVRYEEQKHDKDRLNLYTEEGYLCSVSSNCFVEHHLYVGKEITNQELELIKEDDGREKAYQKALSLAGKKMYTCSEMHGKLSANSFSEDEIQYAMEKMLSYGYLNDEHYAKCYVKEKSKLNGWGSYKIKMNLLAKGIEKEMAEQAVSEYFENEATDEVIYQVALKKYNSLCNKYTKNAEIYQKLSAFLIGRGFGYDEAKEVAMNLVKEE